MASLRTLSACAMRSMASGCRFQSSMSGNRTINHQRKLPTKHRSRFTTKSQTATVPPLQKTPTAAASTQNANLQNPLPVTSSRDQFKKNDKNLMNFESQDLAGALNADPYMFAVECDILGAAGFQNQFNQILDGVDVTSKVCAHLSTLHHSESTTLACGSWKDLVYQFILHLPKQDHVFIDAALAKSRGLGDVTRTHHTFENAQDLANKLSATSSSSRRIIIAQMTSPTDDFQTLLQMADDKEAMVVACDPDGLTHVQHMIGAHGEDEAHYQPLLVFSSLDVFLGSSSLCYVSGPEDFTFWLESRLSESQLAVSSYTVAKANHVLSRPRDLVNNLCHTLLKHLDLQEHLTEAGIEEVTHDRWSLFIGFKNERQLTAANRILLARGFHAGIVNDSEKCGLRINVRPCHTSDDVQNLSVAIVHACRQDPVSTIYSTSLGSNNSELEDVCLDSWEPCKEPCKEPSDIEVDNLDLAARLYAEFVASNSEDPCVPAL